MSCEKVFGDHFEELPAPSYSDEGIEACENGNLGWAFWRCRMSFEPEGTLVVAGYRMTFMLSRYKGAWKVVHVYLSNPDFKNQALGN